MIKKKKKKDKSEYIPFLSFLEEFMYDQGYFFINIW